MLVLHLAQGRTNVNQKKKKKSKIKKYNEQLNVVGIKLLV
jgi:hypothetical protein